MAVKCQITLLMITIWDFSPTKINIWKSSISKLVSQLSQTRILMETWWTFSVYAPGEQLSLEWMGCYLGTQYPFLLIYLWVKQDAEEYHVNWRRWSTSQSKETSLAMSIKQQEGYSMTSLGFMVLHWIFGGGNMACKLAMFQQKVKTTWCMYRCLETMQITCKYSEVCFGNVLWSRKCIQHISWTSSIHKVYFNEKHWL